MLRNIFCNFFNHNTHFWVYNAIIKEQHSQGRVTKMYNGSQMLSTEPIVISTYRGLVTVADVQQAAVELAQMLDNAPSQLYIVVDLLDIDSSFAEVMKIIAQQSQGEAGTTTDPRIGALALVGTNVMAKLYSQAMEKRHEGVRIPMYTRVSDALAAVRMLIQYDHAKKAS
jgi:hypothetical protein